MASVDRNHRPIARINPSQGPTEFTGSTQKPIVATVPSDDFRKAERSRRAIRPAGDPAREDGWNDDGVLKGGKERQHPRAAEPMTPTYGRSVKPVPKDTDRFSGPHYAHSMTFALFEEFSGFGFQRMGWYRNERGGDVASRDIDRVELVSLLTDDAPSVNVLDEVATPVLARQANRRPLDEFERLGLDAVRRGEELVWTQEAPTRMFGAIRARVDCLHCHAKAKEGDLLGAFTYYLKVSVDELDDRK